jgi:hypothetical protein
MFLEIICGTASLIIISGAIYNPFTILFFTLDLVICIIIMENVYDVLLPRRLG